MKRIKVRLGDLLPNPFKKQVMDGRLDEEKVQRLEESIAQHDFWDGLQGRERGSKVEIAFGHHRVEAAKRKLGRDYETWIQVDDFSDAQMLQKLALENSASEGAPEAEQIDVVAITHEFLKKNPTSCRLIPSHSETESSPKGAGAPHVHGSVTCVQSFLGEKNWSRAKVGRLFTLGDIHEDVKKIIESSHNTGEAQKGKTTPTTAAQVLAPLEKPVQKAAAQAIKDADVALPAHAVKNAVSHAMTEAAKEAAPLQRKEAEKIVEKLDVSKAATETIKKAVATNAPERGQKEVAKTLKGAGVAKPEEVAERIVEKSRETLTNVQKDAVGAGIKAAAEVQKQEEALRKSKELEDVAQRLIGAIARFNFSSVLASKDFQEVIRLRGKLTGRRREALIEALRRKARELLEVVDLLEKPAPKELS